MRVITDGRRLSKPQLQIIATLGWVGLIYLAWVVGQDSWERTMFAFGAMAGAIPDLDPFNQRYIDNPGVTLLHTIPGFLFAILGPMQFMGFIRRGAPVVHRTIGRLFLVIGITSGVGAFVMTLVFPIWGWSANVTISLAASVFMVYAFVKAFLNVKARRFGEHREWMIRGFSLGIAVAFFRVMLDHVLPALGMESFDARWNTVIWISFPVLLLIAEFWIRATRPKARSAALEPQIA